MGPLPTIGGSAPAPYNAADSVASASLSAGTMALLGRGTLNASTCILNVQASSNVNGSPGTRNADAAASVANVNVGGSLVGLLGLLNTADLFGFSGSLITSEAHVSGDHGALVASGGSVIVDANGAADGFATFTVLGTNFNIAVDAQGRVAPNTTLSVNALSAASFADLVGVDLTGSIDIVLNEQIITGDGISSRGIEVNALHVSFNAVGAEFFNLLGLNLDDTNLVTGDIIVAHSAATITAVPEPSTAGVVMAGIGVLALRRRRRHG